MAKPQPELGVANGPVAALDLRLARDFGQEQLPP
jgi:hypothetical protein